MRKISKWFNRYIDTTPIPLIMLEAFTLGMVIAFLQTVVIDAIEWYL